MKRVFNIFVILLIFSVLKGKGENYSSQKEPEWFSNVLNGKYFRYYSGIGYSKNLEESKQKAMSDAISDNLQEGTIKVEGKTISRESEYNNNQIGQLYGHFQ